MEFKVKYDDVELQNNNCIIVGIFESCSLSHYAEKINKISKGYLNKYIKIGDLNGHIGQTLLLYNIPNISSERVLFVGCGKKENINILKYKKIIYNAIDFIKNLRIKEIQFYLNQLEIKEINTYWKIRHAIDIFQEMFYKFDKFKINKLKYLYILKKITFNILKQNELIIAKKAIKHGIAISNGIKLAKDLGNLPPNICNPSYLASQVIKLSKKYKETTSYKIIDEKQMKKIGMNAYLAVGKGSVNKSFMSIIKYHGSLNKDIKPIVFIGKGVTFDSGGISIKSADHMHEMKYDMCGAAAVYGIMKVAIKLKLPLNIIGILAGCENMLDSRSFRPGDILTTLSGKTVEIIDTDAEGRLLLCDVLTYVNKFNPEIVIDIATLTGACIIALGHHLTGLMSNNDLIANQILYASEQSNDKAWRLPLCNEFKKKLKSNFADISNVGGRSGGAITAGYFLYCFAKKYNWAHLDIAGTAWDFKKSKGATGRPISMISQFLINLSKIDKN